MDIINEIIEDQYNIEFISYGSEFDNLTKLNGHRITENRVRWCMGYYRNKIDNIRKEISKKYRWEYPPVEVIVRKVGEKHVVSYHGSKILGKLVFTKINSFSIQYHKDFDPKD